MAKITRIKMTNFKRFKTFDAEFQSDLNVLIGDNESGKSTILQAIDIVASASRGKIENYGIDRLFNKESIDSFLSSERSYGDLPVLYIEIYLDEQDNPKLNGRNNTENIECDGLVFECAPNDELSEQIVGILEGSQDNFPFEYYSIQFRTFQGDAYSGYNKFLRKILVDNSTIGYDYALKQFISDMYEAHATDLEIYQNQNRYRQFKKEFATSNFKELNDRIPQYSFAVRHDARSNLETDLTFEENEIPIENKGKGAQCFIKTNFALKKTSKKLDFILIEEPENNLSHINMGKLIEIIKSTEDPQLFLATHSNTVCARLDLRKIKMLNSNSTDLVTLNSLSENTAKYFIKAPSHNVLDFILSQKSILVEGDAEYILMEAFFKKVTDKKPNELGVHIISVDGTSFKRYLEISNLLKIKTGVIRDNDGDFENTCAENYADYISDHVSIFADPSNDNSTFEICLYKKNTEFCNNLFESGRRTLTVQEYMLKNKTTAAYEILENWSNSYVIPDYIIKAIEWIKN